MKINCSLRTTSAILLGTALLLPAATAGADSPKITKEMRVIVAGGGPSLAGALADGPDRKMEFIVHEAAEAEGPSTFLGIETSQVGATLGKQLGLDRGIGLVVARVIPETGAAEVLEKHDIVVKFEDQLLVSPEQLGVLVRSKAAGTRVALTVIRGGKERVVTAELRERKSPVTIKRSRVLPDGENRDALREKVIEMKGDLSRAEVEALLDELRREGDEDVMVWSGQRGRPVVRLMNINQGNIVFTDDEGTTKLISSGEEMRLVVMGPDEELIFDGPISTPEQREQLPAEVRARLEKVESIRAMEIKTGPDFDVDEEVQIAVPHAAANLRIERH